LGHALREMAITERYGRLAAYEHAATFAVVAETTRAAHSHVLLETAVGLAFPDDSVVSASRLRIFPGKPSVSDDFLPK
jgi:hypothetical protein